MDQNQDHWIYVWSWCPGCDYRFEQRRDGTPDRVCVPRHTTGQQGMLGEPCWLSGWTLAEARDMIRMRAENGGRLTHAAHP